MYAKTALRRLPASFVGAREPKRSGQIATRIYAPMSQGHTPRGAASRVRHSTQMPKTSSVQRVGMSTCRWMRTRDGGRMRPAIAGLSGFFAAVGALGLMVDPAGSRCHGRVRWSAGRGGWRPRRSDDVVGVSSTRSEPAALAWESPLGSRRRRFSGGAASRGRGGRGRRGGGGCRGRGRRRAVGRGGRRGRGRCLCGHGGGRSAATASATASA